MRNSSARIKKIMLGCSFGLILLGTGNIIYGQYKTQEYLDLMAASSQTQSDQARETGIPVLDRYIATDAYREQISLVKNRIDLYALTVFGGQLLVSLGGVLLFSWLIIIGKAHLT